MPRRMSTQDEEEFPAGQDLMDEINKQDDDTEFDERCLVRSEKDIIIANAHHHYYHHHHQSSIIIIIKSSSSLITIFIGLKSDPTKIAFDLRPQAHYHNRFINPISPR